MKKTYVLGLCKDRHPAPVNDGIFPEFVMSTFDPDYLYSEADFAIPKDCERLALYVTGLTVAIMAVVRVCSERHIDLVCYHYQKARGTYNRQEVLKF